MITSKQLKGKPSVECDSRIGNQTASERCDATWMEDHQLWPRYGERFRTLWLNTTSISLRGEQVVETLLLTNRSVAMWMSIQSRGFVRLQILNHVIECDFHVKIFVTLHRNENQHIFRAQEMSIHLRTVNIMLRHELETQKRSTTLKKKMLFQDEIGCLHTCRNHLVFRWITVN